MLRWPLGNLRNSLDPKLPLLGKIDKEWWQRKVASVTCNSQGRFLTIVNQENTCGLASALLLGRSDGVLPRYLQNVPSRKRKGTARAIKVKPRRVTRRKKKFPNAPLRMKSRFSAKLQFHVSPFDRISRRYAGLFFLRGECWRA
jgi:hypothetical protein